MTTTTTPRVAVIGVGYWGRNLARNFAELGALASVVDTDESAARDIASATRSSPATLEQVLADPTIAGVAIATTAITHFALASAALRAGKHVYVEKPLVLDQKDADALIALAEECGRILMVGHLLRYHPLFQRMLDAVKSGEHGALRYIHSDRLSFGKVRTEEDVMWSFAPHDISMVLALVGEEPAQVTAQGAAFINPGIADVATTQLTFPSGVKADIKVSWINYCKVQRIAAVCDDATLVFEDSQPEWSRKLSVHEHMIDRSAGKRVPERGAVHHLEVAIAEPLKCECQHFLDRISDGHQPLTDAREGRAVLRVLQLASAEMAKSGAGELTP